MRKYIGEEGVLESRACELSLIYQYVNLCKKRERLAALQPVRMDRNSVHNSSTDLDRTTC